MLERVVEWDVSGGCLKVGGWGGVLGKPKEKSTGWRAIGLVESKTRVCGFTNKRGFCRHCFSFP